MRDSSGPILRPNGNMNRDNDDHDDMTRTVGPGEDNKGKETCEIIPQQGAPETLPLPYAPFSYN